MLCNRPVAVSSVYDDYIIEPTTIIWYNGVTLVLLQYHKELRHVETDVSAETQPLKEEMQNLVAKRNFPKPFHLK